MVASQKGFWKYPQISQTAFLTQVETGDILLFRTNHFVSKTQRAFTRSRYDHVALLFKVHDIVAFIESTSGNGVVISSWNDFIADNWHLNYAKIVYRKLKCRRKEELAPAFEEFISNAQGKKFNGSISKILAKKETNENEGYFCSELVASSYKKAGLLPKEIPASNYWPGNFADERPLYLIAASLSPLSEINFELS